MNILKLWVISFALCAGLYGQCTLILNPITGKLDCSGGAAGPTGSQGPAGEATTASNTGSTGVGVFKSKVSTDLQLYKLAAANNLLTIALSGTDYVNFTINPGNFDLANFGGTLTAGQVPSLLSSKISDFASAVGTAGNAVWQPLAANLTTIAGKTLVGTGASIRYSTGSFTPGNAVTVDASGNLVDSGSAPGGGGVGGSGTVTSVGMTVPSWLSVSPSSINTSGTFAITAPSATQNQILATPNGSSGSPSLRALVAADIPTLTAVKISDFSAATLSATASTYAALIHTHTASDAGLGNVTNNAQLKIASNLSDLANAATARTNLGVPAAPTGGANAPLFNSGAGGFTNGTRSGNTTEVATVSGAKTASKQVTYDSSGNLIVSAYDVGAAGGGTGVAHATCTITSGTSTCTATHSAGLATPSAVITGCKTNNGSAWVEVLPFNYGASFSANAVTFNLSGNATTDTICVANPGRGATGGGVSVSAFTITAGTSTASYTHSLGLTTSPYVPPGIACGTIDGSSNKVQVFPSNFNGSTTNAVTVNLSSNATTDVVCTIGNVGTGGGNVNIKNNAGTTVVTGATAVQFKNGPGTTWVVADEGSGVASATPSIDTTGIVMLTGPQTVAGKTFDNTNTANLKDTLLTVQDDGDATKQAQFQLSGITAGQTRVVTVPNSNGTMMYTTTAVADAQMAAKYTTRVCEIHIWGSGASQVLQDADDEAMSCYNGYGVTETVTAVRCWTNAGSPTVTPVVTAGAGAILSGALTCTTNATAPMGAAGTLSGTPTLASGGTIDANVTSAGGTATNIRLYVTLTR